jgi:hypothetical protein
MATSNPSDEAFRALAALRFSGVARPDDIWAPSNEHVPELHPRVAAEIDNSLLEARHATSESPLALAIEGQSGAGKTHMLGWTRQQVQHSGGYFFLVGLSEGETFWRSVVDAILEGLQRQNGTVRASQLRTLLTGLDERAGASRSMRRVVDGQPFAKSFLDAFIHRLVQAENLGPGARDTARALVLLASRNLALQDVANGYFISSDEILPGARTDWGIQSVRPPQRIAQDLSLLLSKTGHSVIALEQVDSLFARAARSIAALDNAVENEGRDLEVSQVGDGLMQLQQQSQRTLVMITCLPNSWQLIKTRAVGSVVDRFRTSVALSSIRNPNVARSLLQKRLASTYQKLGFTPPHPTWPVAEEAFLTAGNLTPRQLMRQVVAHAQTCLDSKTITELTRLDGTALTTRAVVPKPNRNKEFAQLDAHFGELRKRAEVEPAMDPNTEDLIVPALLRAGLSAWITEQGSSGQKFKLDPPTSSNPPLHAKLRYLVDEATETELHVAFRAISHPHHSAVLPKLRRALTDVGLRSGDRSRRLFILREDKWSGGPKTQEAVAEFQRGGGVKTTLEMDDLRTFEALRSLLDDNDPALAAWLVARRPASQTTLLSTALPPEGTSSPDGRTGDGPDGPDGRLGSGESSSGRERSGSTEVPDAAGGASSPAPAKVVPYTLNPTSIDLGVLKATGEPVTIDLEGLRKHTAIFAGSGSGKTVLIRRLIEECALRGVSSIVLDPNNDLARLGDAWPQPPAEWAESDPGKAAEYFANTDVVVWTPRREGGRPLTFQPLPDFGSVLDDADEFGLAVDVAVAGLAPRAKVDGATRKPQIQRAVLRQSVEYFAKNGAGSLEDLIELMADLPAEVSSMDSADAIAAEMAQTLMAARVNDPLFGGRGAPLDPAVLLTPAPGKRARVSVISLVGLPSDQQRQGFVSQLQMALFSWFKRHPAGDRPLGGLLVMDEAQTIAPSGAMTLSTESTLVLASQARKYGLGLVFATQAPKGLHNRIPGNAATQFFGFLNSPSQITAAQEIARAKGGSVSDISRLRAGEFYVAAEGLGLQRLTAPYCLSHHPKSPLTTDEVITRARRPIED